MSLSNELQRLAELRASGALTEAEFQQAKAKLLENDSGIGGGAGDRQPNESLGRAANRYVTFQMVMAVIGILIFLFVFMPKMCSMERNIPGFPNTPSNFR
jgi:hypothetical protein